MMDNRINLLEQHGITCCLQDGSLMAVDLYTQGENLRYVWVCLDAVNLWHWLGY